MERYHETANLKDYEKYTTAFYESDHAKRVDILITGLLKSISDREKKPVRLVNIQTYQLETQALPPRREIFLTVIAEEAS